MGIFSGTCPVPAGSDSYNVKGTSHNALKWTALVCAAITAASSVSLIFMHLRRYRCPKEQRQIVRIIFVPTVFAVVSFCEILNYEAAQYIDPISEVYESFCLCALFLLYIQFVAPASDYGDNQFEAMEAAADKRAGFDWPRISWVLVFQYPITELLAVIVLEATEAAGDYCVTSLSPKFGHIWVEIIRSLGVGLCVTSILRFYGRMKSLIRARRGLAKLVCFKVIVFLHFIQTWIFSILLDKNVLKPSSSFSYGDLLYGIPNVLTCVEMVLFSLSFWYAYSSNEYSSSMRPGEAPLGLPSAIANSLNPSDLFVGIIRAFRLIFDLQRQGKWSEYRTNKSASKANNPSRYEGLRDASPYGPRNGTTAVPLPNISHNREYSAGSVEYGIAPPGQDFYQPPNGSPPQYDEQSSQLLRTGDRKARSPSPSGRAWNGQSYDRSPSPSARYNVNGQHPRDMV